MDMGNASPYKREGNGFLHRNWKVGIHAMEKGLKLSSSGDRFFGGDLTPPANKRRRLTDGLAVTDPRACMGSLFHHIPAEYEKALRIEVLKIDRDDGSGVHFNSILTANGSPAAPREVPCVKARCKITIFRWKANVEMRVLYCDSQTCSITLARDPDGKCRTARVHLPQPFHISADKLYVERDGDEGFSLADKYLVQAELESAGSPTWPPIELLHSDEFRRPSSDPPRRWVLSSRFVYKFTKGRISTTVSLRKGASPLSETEWKLDMDFRWTSFNAGGLAASARALGVTTPPETQESSVNGALEPLSNGHVNGRVETPMQVDAQDSAERTMDDDEDAEGDSITPNRPLRNRGKQHNYNLKLLSDLARGREAKERKKRKNDGPEKVTWYFPKSAPVTFDNWTCIKCFGEHYSFDMLKAHLEVGQAHPEYKFTFFGTRNARQIGVSEHGQESPRKALSVSGSEDEAESDSGADTAEKSTSRSRLGAPKRGVVSLSTEGKLFIPRDGPECYDRVSKVVLDRNTYVDEPPMEHKWLIQKHGDLIRDFTDMHSEEKAYMIAWDAYCIEHRSALGPYMQEVYLEFLREKADWLLANPKLTTEAMKHVAIMKLREALDDRTVVKGLEILRDVRARRGLIDKEQQQPAGETVEPPQVQAASSSSPKTKNERVSMSGCVVCGQPVGGPGTLICANLDCERPFYHEDCIRAKAKVAVEEKDDWQCNSCCDGDDDMELD